MTNACIMPVGYGLGDHQLFVVDFTVASFIGEYPPTIGRLEARKLNTRIEGCADDYNAELGKNIRRHSFMEKMLAIHQSRLPPKIKKKKLDKSDLYSQQYMKRAEMKCRRIKMGRIPFSPEASIWIRIE